MAATYRGLKRRPRARDVYDTIEVDGKVYQFRRGIPFLGELKEDYFLILRHPGLDELKIHVEPKPVENGEGYTWIPREMFYVRPDGNRSTASFGILRSNSYLDEMLSGKLTELMKKCRR
jgi:hypothetical protein